MTYFVAPSSSPAPPPLPAPTIPHYLPSTQSSAKSDVEQKLQTLQQRIDEAQAQQRELLAQMSYEATAQPQLQPQPQPQQATPLQARQQPQPPQEQQPQHYFGLSHVQPQMQPSQPLPPLPPPLALQGLQQHQQQYPQPVQMQTHQQQPQQQQQPQSSPLGAARAHQLVQPQMPSDFQHLHGQCDHRQVQPQVPSPVGSQTLQPALQKSQPETQKKMLTVAEMANLALVNLQTQRRHQQFLKAAAVNAELEAPQPNISAVPPRQQQQQQVERQQAQQQSQMPQFQSQPWLQQSQQPHQQHQLAQPQPQPYQPQQFVEQPMQQLPQKQLSLQEPPQHQQAFMDFAPSDYRALSQGSLQALQREGFTSLTKDTLSTMDFDRDLTCDDSSNLCGPYDQDLIPSSKTPPVNFNMTAANNSRLPATLPKSYGMTTVTVRNIPYVYTQEMLLQEWPIHEYNIDFLYLPRSPCAHANLSIAFVNFTSEAALQVFKASWQKKKLERSPAKTLNISFANVQGLEANLLMLKKKRVRRMKSRQSQPLVIINGQRIEFTDALDLYCGPKPTDATVEPLFSAGDGGVMPLCPPAARFTDSMRLQSGYGNHGDRFGSTYQ